MSRITSGCLIVVGALLLTACGGGGGGSGNSATTPTPPPVANADPGGIYTGTAVQSTGAVTDVVGIVTESGQAVLFDTTNDGQYAGTITTTGDNLSGSFTGYAPIGEVFLNNAAVTPFSISGTIDPGVSISGTYTGGGGQGTVSVTDDPALYDQGSSLSSLVGTWEGLTASGATLTVTIQSNGAYTGQDTDGCFYSGAFTIINASFDAYDVTTTETCGGTVASASGLATFATDTQTNKPEILYSVSNSTTSITGSIELQ